MDIFTEKAEQASALLAEHELDLWLTFVRETAEHTDPVLKLLGHFSVTWPAALLFWRDGRRVALCGLGDDEALRAQGIFHEVIPYTQSIRVPLVAQLTAGDPQRIGLNWSRSDVSADGLTVGMYQTLLAFTEGTPYHTRFVSAEHFLESWRGRKTEQELARMRAALATAMEIFDETSEWLRPGLTEQEIHAWVTERVAARGVGTAWDAAHCPGLNAGPDSPWGHVGPSAVRLQRGHTLNMDFGVQQDGFCSDNQRTWYVLAEGESAAPPEVQRAFAAVTGAIQAAAAAVRPGVHGWEVDAVARRFIVEAGYPEYPHALGHQVGRYAHDGGVGFYPRWERYGDKPYGTLQAGQVLTLELGVRTEFGYISLEEELLVTDEGYQWMMPPQTELWYVS